MYTSSWPGCSCGSEAWLSWKRDHSMSRETVAPFRPFIPSLLLSSETGQPTSSSLWGYRQCKPLLQWDFYPHTSMLSAAKSFILLHITPAHKHLSLFPTHLPSSDFASPFCSCQNLVPPWAPGSPAACKVSGLPAGNPCTPQEQHLACRNLVPPQKFGVSGS